MDLPATTAKTGSQRAWLVSPGFDLLLVANWGWPLFAALAAFAPNGDVRHGLNLYQAYCITFPHRFITLAVVLLDKKRLSGNPGPVLRTGAFVLALFFLLWLGTGSLNLVLLVDLFWNNWHGASQHSGVNRIYSIQAQPERDSSDAVGKAGLIFFTFYAVMRILDFAQLATGTPFFVGKNVLIFAFGGRFDFLILLLPLTLLIREVFDYRPIFNGRLAHLASVCLIYSGIILSSHYGKHSLMLALVFSQVIFHGVEYLAIVDWSMDKRCRRDEIGVSTFLIRNWTENLGWFIGGIAVAGCLMSSYCAAVWAPIAALTSMLHYAMDGVIWKMRQVFPGVPGAVPAVRPTIAAQALYAADRG